MGRRVDLVEEGVTRWVGAGAPPASLVADATVLDGRGCVAIPGLVNAHDHLYQTLTRARAQEQGLFGWLTELYPVWAGLDAEWVRVAAAAGLAELALSGCSTSTDHHYIFPARTGDLLEAEIDAATGLGIRFHPCRGSMDLGASAGGLPPDALVQDTDTVLDETEQAVRAFHDPTPGSMVRIAIAPCSPFSASGRLMEESARLARRSGCGSTRTSPRRPTRRPSALSASGAVRSNCSSGWGSLATTLASPRRAPFER